MRYLLRFLACILALLCFLISPLFKRSKTGEFSITSRKMREMALDLVKWDGTF